METPAIETQLDLSRYQTDELVDHLVELISVPGAVRKVLSTATIAGLLAVVACGLIHSYSDLTLLPWLAVSGYALLASLALGTACGILRVIRSALGNVQSLLKQGLHITSQAADDYQQIGAGDMRLPAGDELLGQVHSHVLVPAVERAASKAFGVLAKPMLWGYRRTIGSAVALVVRKVARSSDMAEQQERVRKTTLSSLESFSEYSEAIESFTAAAVGVVERIGTRIRFFAMLPLWALFVVAVLVASGPVALALYFN